MPRTLRFARMKTRWFYAVATESGIDRALWRLSWLLQSVMVLPSALRCECPGAGACANRRHLEHDGRDRAAHRRPPCRSRIKGRGHGHV